MSDFECYGAGGVKQMIGYYPEKLQGWKDSLERHLMKQEILWVASHGGGTIDWLTEYCVRKECLLAFLGMLGFRTLGATVEENVEDDGRINTWMCRERP